MGRRARGEDDKKGEKGIDIGRGTRRSKQGDHLASVCAAIDGLLLLREKGQRERGGRALTVCGYEFGPEILGKKGGLVCLIH